jgi:hypothetical protein
MAKNLEYYVLPAKPPDPPNFTTDVSPWGMGCLLMFIALALSLFVERAMGTSPFTLALFFVLEVAAIVLAGAIYGERKKSESDNKNADWMRWRIKEAEERAGELTQRVNQSTDRFSNGLRSLPKLLGEVDMFLDDAEAEFQDKAYSPFWDNIEWAALRLGEFTVSLKCLEKEVGSYNSLLHGQMHNFPPLAVHSVNIPNPARQTERFRHFVRMGQKDFEFATIWEHRKTQKVILEGFRTLGEAVNNLSLTVDDSLARVTKTIEESSNRQREEQVRLRETFESAVTKFEEQKRLYGAL